MKTSTLLMATLLGLTLATAYGQQTQTSTTTTSYMQASKIVGMKVNDSSGQEVGVVKDVVLDRNTGCMAYTVLSAGGSGTRVAGGTKTVAVPWTVYTATSDPSVMTVRVERDRVYNAPVFDYARIDEYSRSGYINNIYSYYGVAPAGGAGIGVSGTATGTYGTQTGVAAQTAATVPPGASPAAPATASPSATVSASPSATAKGRPTATAAASHRGHASPSATADDSTGERKTHEHGESTASPGTSSSRESATSGEGTTEHKAGRRHKTTEEETTGETGSSKRSERSKEKSEAEPTATP